MKKIRFFYLALIIILTMNLCGCSVFTKETNELLSPPKLTGELAPIAEALNESAPSGYIFKYPSEGNYRSAVIQNDINADGVFEAFALYSTVDEDKTYMHINMLFNHSGEWESACEQKIVAGGVEQIEFADINDDNNLEILVGFTVYGTSEKQLAVYSIEGEQLVQQILQRYTHFVCADLLDNDNDEILIINFNPAENSNTATLFGLNGKKVEEISRCQLDASIESVNKPIVASLSNGTPAVYIDEVKGAGAITEVLFVEKNKLVNPMLSSNTGQNILTLRSATILSRDINDDGIVEIPIQSVLPSVFYKNQETLYYTDWYSFNGVMLTKQISTIMNLNDGYYLVVPAKLEGRIAVLKDVDRHIRIIYDYDSKSEIIGEEIARVQMIKEKLWDSADYDKGNFIELARKDGNVFIFRAQGTEAKKAELTEQMKQSFKLIDQEAIK